MKHIIDNIKYNWFEQIPYSVKHIKEVYKLQKKYLGKVRYWHHDWDKVIVCALFPYLNPSFIQKWHRKLNAHHPPENIHYTSLPRFLSHLDEAIIDWESARFTKPDKPLDAWDTCLKYYPYYEYWVKKRLDELHIPYNHNHKSYKDGKFLS